MSEGDGASSQAATPAVSALFCDTSLAARIERAERQLLADACARVSLRLGEVLALPVCGGLAAFTEPGSPLNKVIGLGFEGFDPAAFVEAERAHAARGAALQVELSTLADPDVARWLSGHGYEWVGVENVLGLDPRRVPARAPDPRIAVTSSAPGEIEAWLEVIVGGFAQPDLQGLPAHEAFERAVLERIIRDFAQADGVVRYLAAREGAPAGAASMRVGEGIAQLCGAATLPEHRRQGVQSTLLAHRLSEAARQGCTLAVVTTQPGSKSQENVQRQGFQLLYARNVLRKEPGRAAGAPRSGE